MQIQGVGAQGAYLALQRINSVPNRETEENQEQALATFSTRNDRVTLSAWSITLSQQTTALFRTASASSNPVEGSNAGISPREQVAQMSDLVAELKEDGKISWRIARHLQKTLDLAAKALEHDRPLPAARLLRHVARVADRVGHLDKMPGDAVAELIGSARSIVDQLRDEARLSACCDLSNRAGVLLMKSELNVTITQVSITQQASETGSVPDHGSIDTNQGDND